MKEKFINWKTNSKISGERKNMVGNVFGNLFWRKQWLWLLTGHRRNAL